MLKVLAGGERERRFKLAVIVYLVCTAVFLACAAPETLAAHTPFNHFALQAEAWLRGRLDLGGPPPAYAGMNDFSRFEECWYVPFPPFPALLLVPSVFLSGSAEETRDGRIFVLLAGVAPSVLFLALEKLRRLEVSARSERQNLALSFLFAFGSVYFFSAEQGTVWYAAHIVAAALGALYLLFALDAERPLLAGIALGLGFATRAPLLFALPLFLSEAWRKSLPAGFCTLEAPAESLELVDRRGFARRLGLFMAPIGIVILVTFWHNHARFGDPFEVGYRYLEVVWRARIEKWGLFDYHYLGRNLAVVLTSLPWLGDSNVPFRLSAHGLALWVTTPAYLWVLWPKVRRAPHLALAVTVGAVALPTLLYQNTGWVQFGYRFSNDYAVFLFALLAIGGRRLGVAFWSVSALAVALNAFGALTFNRTEGSRYYVIERTQRVIHEPD
jgi:hypothetical protein